MTIRRVTFIRSLVLAAALVAVGAWSPSHPAAAAGSPNCTPVGGTFMTNLGAIGGTSVPSTTLGRVTGDLSGAVAATIASVRPSGGNLVFTVQHHILTDDGDFVFANEAQATAMAGGGCTSAAVCDCYRSSAYQRRNREVCAGDRRHYQHRRGTSANFASGDLSGETLILRYSGRICFATP